jgi:radical SAM protein (TIGR01212 family)
MATHSSRIRTFSYHYREKHGHGLGKIPLDLGIPCPNRETGGCVFCSARAFAPAYLHNKSDIAQQISAGKKHLLKNRFSRYLAYFQQETPTVMEDEHFIAVCAEVLEDQDCLGLIISTRPDSLPISLLHGLAILLEKSGKSCLFELGLQSVHAASLELLNRNHTYAEFCSCLKELRRFDCFEVGVHLLFGIPGESKEDMVSSVTQVCALGIDALKLHHLQVLRNTPLAQMYERGEVVPFSLEDYLDFLVHVIPLIPANVVIHRLWATAHPDELIAPRWNILATHLSSLLQNMLQEKNVYQGQLSHF